MYNQTERWCARYTDCTHFSMQMKHLPEASTPKTRLDQSTAKRSIISASLPRNIAMACSIGLPLCSFQSSYSYPSPPPPPGKFSRCPSAVAAGGGRRHLGAQRVFLGAIHSFRWGTRYEASYCCSTASSLPPFELDSSNQVVELVLCKPSLSLFRNIAIHQKTGVALSTLLAQTSVDLHCFMCALTKIALITALLLYCVWCVCVKIRRLPKSMRWTRSPPRRAD